MTPCMTSVDNKTAPAHLTAFFSKMKLMKFLKSNGYFLTLMRFRKSLDT